MCMSSLRSALDEMRNQELAAWSDAALEEDFEELQAAAEALESERLRRLAEINRRRCFERQGYLSAAAWLVGAFRMAWSDAGRQVRMARELEEMPRTSAAMGDGRISIAAARVLVSARQANPEEFARSEEMLVDAASSLSVQDLRRAVAYWKEAADTRRSLEEEDQRWGRRGLHVSTTLFGMVRLDGNLDPETGQTLLAALGAAQDA